MADTRWYITLNRDDYTSLSTSQIAAILNTREAAILMSILPLLEDRDNWNTMTDSQWDLVSEIIATLQGKLLS